MISQKYPTVFLDTFKIELNKNRHKNNDFQVFKSPMLYFFLLRNTFSPMNFLMWVGGGRWILDQFDLILAISALINAHTSALGPQCPL